MTPVYVLYLNKKVWLQKHENSTQKMKENFDILGNILLCFLAESQMK